MTFITQLAIRKIFFIFLKKKYDLIALDLTGIFVSILFFNPNTPLFEKPFDKVYENLNSKYEFIYYFNKNSKIIKNLNLNNNIQSTLINLFFNYIC
jgi:hypothetical protein